MVAWPSGYESQAWLSSQPKQKFLCDEATRSARKYLILKWTNHHCLYLTQCRTIGCILFLILFLLNIIHHSCLSYPVNFCISTWLLLLLSKTHYNYWYEGCFMPILHINSNRALLLKEGFKQGQHIETVYHSHMNEQQILLASLVVSRFS